MSAIRLVANLWAALFLLLWGSFLAGEWAVAGPAASQASSVRDRLADAAWGTRELSGRAAPGDPEVVKRRGILLDPSLPIFPSPEDLRRYPSVRPCADVFARNPSVRAAAKTPWTAADAPALREAMSDRDPAVRALAIEALATLYDPEDVPRIGVLLTDDAAAPPALEEAMMFSSLPFIREPRATPAAVDVGHYWAQMKVTDYAARALRVMTGRVLDARTFPAWWKVHGDARNSLWYWQERFSREMEAARQGLPASPTSLGPPDAVRARRDEVAAVRRTFAAQLAALPPETEAKVLLLAESPYAGGPAIAAPEGSLFEYPLAPRVGPGRLLDLLARKGLWADVEWNGIPPPLQSGDEGPREEPWWKYDASPPAREYYNRMAERIGLSAATVFCREDAARLEEVLQREADALWWSGRAALIQGISRLLPPEKPSGAGGPDTREGFLRTAARDDEVFVRAEAAAELVRVDLAGQRAFLREIFFAEEEESAYPNVRQTILDALSRKPVTDDTARKFLAGLLVDPGFRPLWSRQDDRYRDGARRAVNALAGRDVIRDEDLRDLRDPERGPKAVAALEALIRTWGGEAGAPPLGAHQGARRAISELSVA
jgi:hypothetical protein